MSYQLGGAVNYTEEEWDEFAALLPQANPPRVNLYYVGASRLGPPSQAFPETIARVMASVRVDGQWHVYIKETEYFVSNVYQAQEQLRRAIREAAPEVDIVMPRERTRIAA
jgi:hypothetical protein